MPTATKMAARMTVCKVGVYFLNLFTFSFRVACFSILSDCFGLRDGLPLSSHHTPPSLFCRLFVHQEAFKSQSRSPRCGANVEQLRANSTKAAAVRRSGETFLKESAPCCQIFSFFSCLFSPVAIADFWPLRRGSLWEPDSGKEKYR